MRSLRCRWKCFRFSVEIWSRGSRKYKTGLRVRSGGPAWGGESLPVWGWSGAAAHSSAKDFLFARVTITDSEERRFQTRAPRLHCPSAREWPLRHRKVMRTRRALSLQVLVKVAVTVLSLPPKGGNIWALPLGYVLCLHQHALSYPLSLLSIPFQRRENWVLEFSNNLPRVTKLVNATVRIQIFLRNGEMGVVQSIGSVSRLSGFEFPLQCLLAVRCSMPYLASPSFPCLTVKLWQ